MSMAAVVPATPSPPLPRDYDSGKNTAKPKFTYSRASPEVRWPQLQKVQIAEPDMENLPDYGIVKDCVRTLEFQWPIPSQPQVPDPLHSRRLSKLALKKAKDWKLRVQRLSDAICKLGENQFVSDLLERWPDQLSPTDFCFVVKQVGNCKWQRSLELYECLNISSWYTPNPRMLATIISVLRKSNQPTIAEELFERAASSIGNCVQVYNAMLSVYITHGGWQKMQQLLLHMEAQGCKHDLVTANVVIKARTKEGMKPGMAMALLQDVYNGGLKPDAITYNTLISACSLAQCWTDAIQVFEEMNKHRCEPDIWTYNAMISVYGRSGAIESASKVFEIMQLKGFDPDAITYNSILYAFAKGGRINDVDKIKETMEASGCRADSITYNTMIHMYGKEGLHHKALDLYNQMKIHGCSPDAVTFTVLIDSLGKEGHVDEAAKMFADMLKAEIRPTLHAFSAMICAYAKAGKYTQAEKTFECMIHSGIHPDFLAYSVMADLFYKAGKPEQALSTFRSMRRAGFRPDLYLYSFIFKIFFQRGKGEVEELSRDMLQSGIDLNALSSLLLKGGHYVEATEALRLVASQGQPMDGSVVSGILYQLARAERYADAERIAQSLLDCDPNSAVLIHECLAIMFAKTEKHEEAKLELEKLETQGGTASFPAYNALLISYEQAGMFNEALNIFLRMQDYGMLIDFDSYRSAVTAYCKTGKPDIAYNLLHQCIVNLGPLKESSLYILIIETYGKQQLWQDAEKVFTELQQSGLTVACRAYNALLSAYAESSKDALAMDTLLAMVKSKISPTTASANYVLEAVRNAGKASELDLLYHKIRELGISPNLKSFLIMMNAFSQEGSVQAAKKLYHDLKSAGFLPNMPIFKELISLFCKEGSCQDAEDMIKEMKPAGFEPDVFIYNSMISMYSKLGSYKSATLVFQGMKAVGCQPDTSTYNLLIKLYSQHFMVQQAQTLFQEMHKVGSTPDIASYTMLISAYGKLHSWESAEAIFNSMLESNCKPDEVVFNAIINVYRKAGKHQLAEAMISKMRDMGLRPTPVTLHMLMDSYGKGGQPEGAETIFESLRDAGINPDVRQYTSLIDAYLKAGDYTLAIQKLKEMKNEGLEPNYVTVTCIIGAASMCETKGQVLALLGALQSVGFSLPYRLLTEKGEDLLCDIRDVLQQLYCIGPEAGQGIVNVVLDLLWAFQKRATAARVLNIAMEANIYPHGIARVQEKNWGADFRKLSPGAALVALTLWLDQMQDASLQGVPESSKSVMLIMGGSKYNNQVSVSKTLKVHLWAMGSPFLPSRTREGIFIAKGYSLRHWLKDSSYCMDLELKDFKQPPEANAMKIYNGAFMRQELVSVVKEIEEKMGDVTPKKFSRLAHFSSTKRTSAIVADLKGRAEKIAKRKARLKVPYSEMGKTREGK